jgi:hypothetical protein
VSNGSGLSRGDRNRDARLARLRELVPHADAIVGTGLADDEQAVVVTDHDWRVIARRQVRARAWELGGLLDWPVLVGLAGHTGMIAEPRPPGPRQMPGTLPAAGYGGSPGCREAGDPTRGSVRISISASRAVTRVAEENAYTAA